MKQSVIKILLVLSAAILICNCKISAQLPAQSVLQKVIIIRHGEKA